MMETQKLGQNSDVIQFQSIGDGLNTAEEVIGVNTVVVGSGERRKRGRPLTVKKIKEAEEEEDVCFICFDGGSLVLCDHRGCPKAYHPACIKRDEEFFESAAKWNCGWHICSICQKTAHHMCYTCTYSLCRGCVRKADYVCVRGDKGLCTICMKTILLIENNGQGEDGKVQADFDDKLSWEYLFKVYWIYIKGKLSLTLEELTQAKTAWKEANTISSTLPSTSVHDKPVNDRSMTSATPIANLEEENKSKRRKKYEQIIIKTETVNIEKPIISDSSTSEWATKELLDFVSHMKDGCTTVFSRIDVHAMMMEYINKNNLFDPKKKSQIICDSRLNSLFGKPRVGRGQMLKLLEHHFVVKEDLKKRRVNRGAVRVDLDWNSDIKKHKGRSKGEEGTLHNNLNEFAAIDVYNMKLIYLRRDLMVNLLADSDSFHGKVVGSVVRIRISGCDLKHDMYRLVQVVGTSKVDIPYKIDSKLTDVMLEVLNLDKKETISIDAISDQEFSEEECKRLQRSIRCGLVKHFTVGEIQVKATALWSVKLNDWIENEILRLNHLRDVAREKGHKKSYKECVEKIQLLKTPEERERRLNEIPDVHLDPKMNPDYESDDTEEYFNKEQGDHMESKYSSKNSRPPKRRENRSRKDDKPKKPNNPTGTSSPIVEQENDAPASILEKSEPEVDANRSTVTKLDQQATVSSSVGTNPALEPKPEPEPEHSRPPKRRENRSRKDDKPKKPNNQTVTSSPIVEQENDAPASVLEKSEPEVDANGSTVTKLDQQATVSSSVGTNPALEPKPEPEAMASVNISNTSYPNETIWHYLDPNGKVQGPFSLVQLQRWSQSGYFPVEMRIWADHKDKPVLLTDVLDQQFHNKVGDQTEGVGAPVVANLVNHEKLSDSQSFGQNWSANNNNNGNNNNNSNKLNYNPPSVESTIQLDASNIPTSDIEKPEGDVKHAPIPVIDLPGPTPKNNPPSWSSASSLVVGGGHLPVNSNGMGKHEDWDSGIVLELAADHAATPTSNIDQNADPTQPMVNDFTWHGVGEMIEFSTLAEESVSDLLAEVDAMESQYGLPSPTSRRNSFVDDLFNGSFDEFSPTPDPGTRSDGFSSSGDVPLHGQSTATPDEHLIGSSSNNNINGVQQNTFISSELTNTGSLGFNWPEMEHAPQMIDINQTAKAESDDVEMETKTEMKTKVKLEYGMQAPKPIGIGAKLVTRVAQIKGLECASNPPPPPLTLGLDPYDPCELGSETVEGSSGTNGKTIMSRSGNVWWDPHHLSQRKYGGEKVNSSSSSPQERSRSLLFGSDSGKGQRVCRFYESGRCKKGASCNYLHPSQ